MKETIKKIDFFKLFLFKLGLGPRPRRFPDPDFFGHFFPLSSLLLFTNLMFLVFYKIVRNLGAKLFETKKPLKIKKKLKINSK